MIVITTQCFPPDRGGIEALMGGLAGALHATGHDVAVLADRVRTPDAPPFAPPYRLRRFSGPRPLRSFRKARAVVAFVRANDVAAVFADSWKSAERLRAISASVAVLVHGTEIPDEPSARKRARIVATLARARAVIANSRYTADAVRPYLSDDDRRLRIVHPPIGPQIDPQRVARAQVGAIVGEHTPVILTVARLEPRKGVDMVIRALPAVLMSHANAIYLVAGGGEDAARLQALAVEVGVADRVRFVGPVDGEIKAAYFAGADVFAMPARKIANSVESFGIAYVEAGWYGVPSLAGSDGGASDAVEDGSTGLICDGSDPTSVAEKLLMLLDKARRTPMGATAQARARGPSQWIATLPLYLDALK